MCVVVSYITNARSGGGRPHFQIDLPRYNMFCGLSVKLISKHCIWALTNHAMNLMLDFSGVISKNAITWICKVAAPWAVACPVCAMWYVHCATYLLWKRKTSEPQHSQREIVGRQQDHSESFNEVVFKFQRSIYCRNPEMEIWVFCDQMICWP